VKFRSSFYDDLSSTFGFGRADLLASFALFDDDPGKINEVDELIDKVTPELIRKTAEEYLRPTNETVLIVHPSKVMAKKEGVDAN
jgi:predicted Zn-dependent peptidase